MNPNHRIMSDKLRSPSVNAGSMADIAFLLLVFFLMVTTLLSEEGIQRKLPRYSESAPTAPIPDHNILPIFINGKGELLIETDYAGLEDLREKVKVFVDNNRDGSCDYCSGTGTDELSDNPREAVISIAADRSASYAVYVSVQNEVAAAYRELREDLSQRLYGKDFSDLMAHDQMVIMDAYPMVISEAEVQMSGTIASQP